MRPMHATASDMQRTHTECARIGAGYRKDNT